MTSHRTFLPGVALATLLSGCLDPAVETTGTTRAQLTTTDLARFDHVFSMASDGVHLYVDHQAGDQEALARLPVDAEIGEGLLLELVEVGAHHALTVDRTHLYWTDLEGRVLRRPLAGDTTAMLADVDGTVADLAVDATHVYFTVRGFGSPVKRVPLAGGATHTVAADQEDPFAIAVDDTQIFWTTLGQGNAAIGCTPGEGKVWRRSKFGGLAMPVALGDNCPTAIAADAASVFWSSWVGNLTRASKLAGLPTRVRADAGEILAADRDTLVYLAGDPAVLVTRTAGVEHPLVPSSATVAALDADRVFWAEPILDAEGEYRGMAIRAAPRP